MIRAELVSILPLILLTLSTPDSCSADPIVGSYRPDWSSNGLIAFDSKRSGHSEIYVVADDGNGLTRLTFGKDENIAPSWSPDGSKIAFRTRQSGKWNTLVMSADGTKVRRLDGGDALPERSTWSPDGRRVAISTVESADSSSSIVAISLSDENRRILFSEPDSPAKNPDWSPDGLRIAFTATLEGDEDIYAMEVDGSNVVRLTKSRAADRAPAWSPDGTKIAFQSNRDGIWEIYVMNPDGSNPRRIAHTGSNHTQPTWSLDGEKMAFECLASEYDRELAQRLQQQAKSQIPRGSVLAGPLPGSPSAQRRWREVCVTHLDRNIWRHTYSDWPSRQP